VGSCPLRELARLLLRGVIAHDVVAPLALLRENDVYTQNSGTMNIPQYITKRHLVEEVSPMKRRLSILAVLVVLALASTPRVASDLYGFDRCTQVSACEVECCDSLGFCIVYQQTGCSN
jgi:hypothetical protein